MADLFVGSCIDVMKKHIPDQSIDIIITSPPYNVRQSYDQYNDQMPAKEYLMLLESFFIQAKRVLTVDGRLCINVPDGATIVPGDSSKHQEPEIIYLGSEIAALAKTCRFIPREHITWVQGGSPKGYAGTSTKWGSYRNPSNPYLRNFKESIFVMNNGPWRKASNGRTRDITGDQFLRWSVNVWCFPPVIQRGKDGVPRTGHPTPFPEELPHRLLKFYTFVGDTVLDPFCGIGTTLWAAERIGRRAIGIDISQDYIEKARLNLANPPRLKLASPSSKSRQSKPKKRRSAGS